MKKYTLIIIALTAVFQLKAQYTFQVGNGGNGLALPYTNQYEYNWCTVIYPQEKIKIGGDITKISYFLTAATVSSETTNNQEVYMAHTADVEFSDAGYPDTASMTLVYQGPVQYYDYRLNLTEITLTTPFAYNNNDNLIVHIENHDGNKNSFSDQFLYNYSTTALNFPCKFNQQDGSFPETTGSRTHESPNIRLTFDSGLDAGISKINDNRDFLMPGLQDVTVNFSNYMADVITSVDIEWEINGIPQTTYNWTGSLNPGEESAEIIIANDYDFYPDTFTIKVWTANPNAGTDELNTNDTIIQSIYVADYVEIGEKSFSQTTLPYPTTTRYGWSSSIYKKDSLLYGKICGLAYNIQSSGYNLENQKIYLSESTSEIFSSADLPEETSMNLVYTGRIDYSGSVGWKKINFDSIFSYDNNNIQVHYRNYSGQFNSPYSSFILTDYGESVSIYLGAGSAFPTTAGSTTGRAPDIRLYYLIPTDAGISSLDAPGTYFSTGNNNIAVSLKNFGTDTIKSANIYYQVDDGTIQTFNWTGELSCYSAEQNIVIGNESFSYGEHTIKIWTDTPNGLNDYKNENDTLIKTVYATNPLCGNYIIGEAPSDYSTIKEAIDTLHSAGISCDVVFDIKPGSYNGQYLLNEINDAGQNSTVTFQSQTGDSTDVILTTDSTDYLFKLNGVDYIRFKHLTLTSDSAEKFIVLDSGACNNTFEKNQFIDGVYHIFNTETTIADTNNTIHDNLFLNGSTAVYCYSVNGVFETGNIISSNTFKNQTENSIENSYQENMIISGNSFEINRLAVNSTGMKKCAITKNKIKTEWAALYFLGSSDTNLVANNFILCESNPFSAYSIRLSTNDLKFYNNTIKSIGDQNLNTILQVYGNNNDFKNNILVNLKSGPTISIGFGYTGNISDNNCMYSNGESIAEWQNNKCADLSEWQTTSGLDANSISFYPDFFSETDLHTNALAIDGKGTPLTGVTDDIDGEIRDASNPDIGADEFTSTCSGTLSGSYIIGTSGDYSTINDAVYALRNCGVSGSVTFNIESNTYNEQVNIDEYISGFTENDTIIFQSATGDSTDVILTYKADTLNNYTLKLNGTDRCVINQITIHAEDTTYGRAIEISNGACNNLIKNCIISGEVSDEDNNYQALVYFPEDPDSRDTSNIILGNRFVNGSYGIYLSGNSGNKTTFNTISGNTFTNQASHGIYANEQRNLLIEKNLVENNYQLDIHYYGVRIDWRVDSAVISKNRIDINRDNNSYGLSIAGLKNLVFNNFISVSSNTQATGVFNSGYYTKIYNNSINIPSGTVNSYALQLESSTGSTHEDNEITNNVLSNNAKGYAFYSRFSENKILSSDFNNLFSNGDNIVFWGGNDISNLSEWQTASGFGSNSVSSYPNFISDSDLHTSNVLLNNAATPLPEVTDDIDGEPRDATTPDIGADEFTGVTYSLEDDITVCVDAEYKIDAGEGFDSYLWSTGADSSYILVDSTGIGYGSKEYFVTVTLDGNSYSDSITVTFSSPIAMSQDYFCADASTDSVLLTANEGVEYYWSTGDTTQSIWLTGTYVYVTVTDANGCQDTKYISRQWNNCPANFAMPDDTTIYITDSIVIDANSYCDANYDNYSYLWSTGDTTETITVKATALGVGSYNYSVSVTNNSSANTCVTTDQINVEVTNENAIETLVKDGISIYPNPTDGIINLEFRNRIENTWIRITNVTGREVYAEYLKNFTGIKTFDLSGIDKGIYIISVQNENTNLTSKIVFY
jgi:hypothetical protein